MKNKKIVITSIITICLIILSYFLGYYLDSDCSDFLCFKPKQIGVMYMILFTPIIVLIGSIYLSTHAKKEDKHPGIKYISIILVSLVIISLVFMVQNKIDRRRADNEKKEIYSIDNKYINAEIPEIIHEEYPKAIVHKDYDDNGIEKIFVDLKDYSKNNKPNLDNELNKWKTIKEKDAIKNSKFDIVINYYYENDREPFAYILLDKLKVVYK